MARDRDKFSGKDWLATLGIAGGLALAFWGRKAVAKPSSGSTPDQGPAPSPYPGRPGRPWPPRRPVNPKPERVPTGNAGSSLCTKNQLTPAEVQRMLDAFADFMARQDIPEVPYEQAEKFAFNLTRSFMAEFCPGYEYPTDLALVGLFKSTHPGGWWTIYEYASGSIFRRVVPGYT